MSSISCQIIDKTGCGVRGVHALLHCKDHHDPANAQFGSASDAGGEFGKWIPLHHSAAAGFSAPPPTSLISLTFIIPDRLAVHRCIQTEVGVSWARPVKFTLVIHNAGYSLEQSCPGNNTLDTHDSSDCEMIDVWTLSPQLLPQESQNGLAINDELRCNYSAVAPEVEYQTHLNNPRERLPARSRPNKRGRTSPDISEGEKPGFQRGHGRGRGGARGGKRRRRQRTPDSEKRFQSPTPDYPSDGRYSRRKPRSSWL